MTNQAAPCLHRSLVDRHFGAGLGPEREAKLRTHLVGCPACRRRYDRQLLYRQLVREDPGPARRLAAGLGLALARERRSFATARRRLTSTLVVACAAGFALFAGRWVPERSDGVRLAASRDPAAFVARGGEPIARSQASLEVYRLPENGMPAALGRAFGRSDGLAFAYRNPAGFSRLLVFGVDENRQVYWFHPAWVDPSDNPTAVAIEPGQELRELPIVVRHDYAGDDLRLMALFTDRALTVREVEAVVSKGSYDMPGTYRLEWDLEIAP